MRTALFDSSLEICKQLNTQLEIESRDINLGGISLEMVFKSHRTEIIQGVSSRGLNE